VLQLFTNYSASDPSRADPQPELSFPYLQMCPVCTKN